MKKTIALYFLMTASAFAAAPAKDLQLDCRGMGLHDGKPATFYATLSREEGLKVGEKTMDGSWSDSDEGTYEQVKVWQEKGKQVLGYGDGLKITRISAVEVILHRSEGWGTSDPKGETVKLLCSINE
ncbi:MAG: hypothetical protein ACXVBE_17370 [Bdellovibrionota bacterium]